LQPIEGTFDKVNNMKEMEGNNNMLSLCHV
jgi:hypothetical protein